MEWPSDSRQLLDYALYYQANNIPIFPLAPKQKIPLLSRESGGAGCYDATTDLRQIREWWTKYPTANIGIACGKRIDVLDIDSYAGGEESLTGHDPIKAVVEVYTPRGGSHIYFAPSKIPIKNKARITTGLDIRSFGGYVVAPPSRIEEGRYRWKTAALNGQVLPEFPDWIIEKCKRDDPVDIAGLWEGELDDGTKHQQIIRSIYFLRMKDFPMEITKEIIANAIMKIDPSRLGGERQDHTLRKYLREIENCYKKYAPDATASDIPVMTRGLPIRTLQKDDFKPVKMTHLIDPYFPKGKCVLLDATGGTGKSALLIALAASMSRGLEPIFGETMEPKKTLYLHKGEDTDEELATVYTGNGGDLDMISFYAGDLMLDEAGCQKIEEAIVDGGFDMVVFDALFYFLLDLMENTNSNLPAMRVMERLNGIATRTGVVIVNIRHTKKGNVDTKAEDMGMGSVQFRNSHRGQLVARWHPDKKGVVVVTDEKGALLNKRGPHFCYRRNDLAIEFIHNEPNPFEKGNSMEDHDPDPNKEIEGDDLFREVARWNDK